MKIFLIESEILDILQSRYWRDDDEFWDIERYKSAFEKVEQFYDIVDDLIEGQEESLEKKDIKSENSIGKQLIMFRSNVTSIKQDN